MKSSIRDKRCFLSFFPRISCSVYVFVAIPYAVAFKVWKVLIPHAVNHIILIFQILSFVSSFVTCVLTDAAVVVSPALSLSISQQ